MEPIKLFLGILLIICLLLSMDFKKIHSYFGERKISHVKMQYESIMGLNVKDFKGRVKIIDVLDYTPARRAGLEIGDRILKVNGVKIINAKSFVENIQNIHAKEPIELVVHRIDSCSTFPVKIVPEGVQCRTKY